MEQVSLRVAAMAESETLVMSQKSRELQAQGIDVINLSVGEPDFATPDHIKEAAKRAIDENYSYYTPVPGFPQLRKLIAEKLERENGLSYSFDQIIVSNGAKHSLMNAFFSILNPGDEAIIPAPYWVSYLEMVKLSEGKSVIIYTTQDNDFKITPEQLEAAITPSTRILLLNSPSNPTGSVYSHDELKAIAKVLEKYPRIMILSDEIYEYILYEGEHVSIASFPGMKERTIIINGVSKGFAMTGWRMGFMAAPKWVVKACDKLQGQQTSGSSSISQMAAIAAYSGGLNASMKMRDAFKYRRDMTLKLLKEIEGIKVNTPPGAFYLFPDVSYYFGKKSGNREINNADQLCMYLLEEGHVACVSGNAFGSPCNIRISYAAAEDKLIEAVKRIKTTLEKLK